VKTRMLKALIFDVDGTLAETERDGHRIAFNLAFSDAGLNWVWDEALYGELLSVTGGKERIHHFIKSYLPALPAGAADDINGFVLRLQALKTGHYLELVRHGEIAPRPGVLRLLREARAAGLRLAIATTSSHESVEALLLSFGADALGWFEVIGAGDSVALKKPAPDIYRYVLAKLGLAAAECLAFEDSDNGFLAAQRAAIPVIVTLNDYTAHQHFDGAVIVVDHLGEPGNPLTCLKGQLAPGCGFLDVDVLKRLHADVCCKNDSLV
jgi:HAD superfamily hydrolase (TIGR01509 family)